METTLQSGKRVAAISFDISGAFDHAWHPAIVINLYNQDCPPHYLLLIADFLSGRHTLFDYGGGSASKNLSLGTPQGAVLSPFLWNVFINPLLCRLRNLGLSVQFAWADDLLICVEYDKNHLDKLRQDVNLIVACLLEWAEENGVTFGPTKTHFVCFGSPRRKSIVIDNSLTTPCLRLHCARESRNWRSSAK